MLNDPLSSVTSADPSSDIFERLLQCQHLLTAQELATILHLSPKTLYSYAERNLIPHFKIETNVRFHGGEVAHSLQSRSFRAGHPIFGLPAGVAPFSTRTRRRPHHTDL